MPVSDYTPSLTDVAAEIPTRTRDSSGEETGTFSPDTDPTDAQVNSLIAKAVDDIEAEFGPDLPTQDINGDPVDFTDRVKQLAALAAALRVERTRFPEQVATNRSPYKQMLDEFTASLARLQRQIEAATGGEGDTGGEPGALAQYYFDNTTEGWDTKRF